ncbi:MAG: phospholipase [Lysobacterales bacterium CG02_land_8_20_14_3_00_62_12]|nr:MAG: phospholipase [Xanthomonadales bacterium CG02_land_8_20_14_3_00_62_12]
MNRALSHSLIGLALLVLGACASTPTMRRQAHHIVEATAASELTCTAIDRCALASPYQLLAEQLVADSAASTAPHAVNLLDDGQTALALRIHLIRSAKVSIELQSYIFETDDVGQLTLHELLDAARRGVKVRVLLDQLSSIHNRAWLNYLARAHVNFQLRVYNPTFDKATTKPLEYVAGVICCFFQFNQRAHNKILLIDQRIGMVGGRNIADRYFDLDPTYNYRDRDILLVGREGRVMRASFDRFWEHPRARSLDSLRDVGSGLLDSGLALPQAPSLHYQQPELIERIQQRAADPAFIQQTFFEQRFTVAKLSYYSDPPRKRGHHQQPDKAERRALSGKIAELISSAENEVVMQTPYLVLSKPARRAFLALRQSHPDLRVIVSTNSLAATDTFPVYAISYKHRRLHLQKLGFELYEFKPYPGRSERALKPVKDIGLLGSARALTSTKSLPLMRDGMRRRLHSKSIVIDGATSLIGSHNFDPRSHSYNTENGVIVHDLAFAAALRNSILADIEPDQSWVVARKHDRGLLTSINQGIESVSEKIPFFDIWPWRYATSYELRPQCAPLRASDPKFYQCYVRVGDFPEVNLSTRAIYTRIITIFGGGLTPIL